jgi:hypothetical protein
MPMRNHRDAEILALIGRLSNEIRLARKHSLGHTVRLLEMAKLDLKMIMHEISDNELRQFAEALDGVGLERTNLC